MNKVNSFTLDRTDLEEGIATLITRQGQQYVCLGDQQNGLDVLLGDHAWNNRPLRDRTHILRSGPLTVRNNLRLIMPNDDWRGIMIRVTARALNLRAAPFASDLNLNPGGEGLRPLAQSGAHRNNPTKDQLFCVLPGEELIVIDQKRAVMLIHNQQGVPIMRPIEREDLIDYVIKRGMQGNNGSQVSWAFHTVQKLGGGTHAALQKRYHEITRAG